MSTSSRKLDRLEATFDHDGIVANAGLLVAGHPPVTNRTRRTRLIAVAAIIVNRSGRMLLRLPARWPWAEQFRTALDTIRALPAPSG